MTWNGLKSGTKFILVTSRGGWKLSESWAFFPCKTFSDEETRRQTRKWKYDHVLTFISTIQLLLTSFSLVLVLLVLIIVLVVLGFKLWAGGRRVVDGELRTVRGETIFAVKFAMRRIPGAIRATNGRWGFLGTFLDTAALCEAIRSNFTLLSSTAPPTVACSDWTEWL